MRPIIALLLVLVILSSGFLLVNPAQAQYSPPIPQFTLKFDNESYNVPATSTSQGYHVDKEFIDVIIKNNNAFSFYAVVNESLVKLYYNIRVKDHYQNWSNCTVSPNLAPSNSNYTTVKFGLGRVNPDPGGFSIWIGNITNGNQVDFQVQGVDGFYSKLTQENPPCWRLPQFSIFNETGASGWSSTQTISASAVSTTTPTETPSTPTTPASAANAVAKGFSPTTLTVSIAAIMIAISACTLRYLRRPRKHKDPLIPSEAGRIT
jgi:hypothetical protein